MTYAQIFTSFLIETNRGDEIINDENDGCLELLTTLMITNQLCTLFIKGDENSHQFLMMLSLPFHVNIEKFSDACKLFNFINSRFTFPGRIEVDENNKICYKEIIDTENIQPSTDILNGMIDNGTRFITDFLEAVAAVALTAKSYDLIRHEYNKRAAQRDAAKNRK